MLSTSSAIASLPSGTDRLASAGRRGKHSPTKRPLDHRSNPTPLIYFGVLPVQPHSFQVDLVHLQDQANGGDPVAVALAVSDDAEDTIDQGLALFGRERPRFAHPRPEETGGGWARW